MLNAEWPKQVVLGKGEKERRERRKEKRKGKKKKTKRNRKKVKKKRKKRKKGKKVWGMQTEIIKQKNKTQTNTQTRKHGGVSSDSVYFKSLDFPWNWSV